MEEFVWGGFPTKVNLSPDLTRELARPSPPGGPQALCLPHEDMRLDTEESSSDSKPQPPGDSFVADKVLSWTEGKTRRWTGEVGVWKLAVAVNITLCLKAV